MSKKGVLAAMFGLYAISIPTAAFAHDDWGHHRVTHNHRYAGAYGSYGNGAYRSYGYPRHGSSAIFISSSHGHHYGRGQGSYRHNYNDDGHGYSHHSGYGSGHGDGYNSSHRYGHGDGYSGGYSGAHGGGDHGYSGHGQDQH